MGWGDVTGWLSSHGPAAGYKGSNTPTSTLTPEQAAYLKQMLPFLMGQVNAGAQPSTTITPETTQNYWESTVRDPALQNWEQNTKGNILAGAGTLHSGYTANTLAREYANLQNNLQGQRGNLMYQDELSRRQLAESGAGRYQNTIQQMLAALGLGGVENIVDKPGMLEGALGGGSLWGFA